jgi:hypothetical protein
MSLSLILKDLSSNNNIIRKQAEDEVEKLLSNDYGSFLSECANVLANEDAVPGVRQMASILIRNFIVEPEHQGKWQQLDSKTKLFIKSTILDASQSPDKDTSNAASLAVAGKLILIFRDLPFGYYE